MHTRNTKGCYASRMCVSFNYDFFYGDFNLMGCRQYSEINSTTLLLTRVHNTAIPTEKFNLAVAISAHRSTLLVALVYIYIVPRERRIKKKKIFHIKPLMYIYTSTLSRLPICHAPKCHSKGCWCHSRHFSSLLAHAPTPCTCGPFRYRQSRFHPSRRHRRPL